MYHCYKKVREIGGIAQVHAENGTLIAEVTLKLKKYIYDKLLLILIIQYIINSDI